MFIGLLASVLLIVAQSFPAGASTASFGAKLDRFTQPSNAEGGRACSDVGSIPEGVACTWVAHRAHRNEGKQAAPRDGTIRQVKLISCVAGSFRLQLARSRSSGDEAKIVRNGPLISYKADKYETDGDPDTFCGGEDADEFAVQSFNVNFTVRKGDLIAINAKQTGTLYCSGDNGVNVFHPTLPVGGPYAPADDETSCMMLIRLVYG